MWWLFRRFNCKQCVALSRHGNTCLLLCLHLCTVHVLYYTSVIYYITDVYSTTYYVIIFMITLQGICNVYNVMNRNVWLLIVATLFQGLYSL